MTWTAIPNRAQRKRRDPRPLFVVRGAGSGSFNIAADTLLGMPLFVEWLRDGDQFAVKPAQSPTMSTFRVTTTPNGKLIGIPKDPRPDPGTYILERDGDVFRLVPE